MATITTTKGIQVTVSNEDYDYLNQFSWYSFLKNTKNYLMIHKYFFRLEKTEEKYDNGNYKYKRIFMHREILERKTGKKYENKFPDHEDLNVLNNTRENLRWSTHQQNCSNVFARNDRQYKGVTELISYKTKKFYGYKAQITHKGKSIYLGCFSTQEEAAKVYDKETKRLNKEFGRTNF